VKWPWIRKQVPSPARALSIGDAWSFRHPVDPPLAPRLAVRDARDAVHKAVTEMNERGSLDAGNGDVLDAWIDSLRPQWIAHHVMAGTDSEAAAQLAVGEYEAAAAAARARAEARKEERDHTQRLLGIFEQRLVKPNEAPAMVHADRRRRPRPSLDALEGLTPQRGWKFVSILLLALATAGDLASFYIALAGMTGQEAWMVWLLTVALTAAAVGIMHVVGRTARNLREGQGGLGRTALVLMTIGWVVLGAAAFFVRTQVEAPTASTGVPAFGGGESAAAGGDDPLLCALLLAALYVGSGILAFYIGFSDHHPRMAAYLRLRADLVTQQEQPAQAEETAIDAERRFETAKAEVARTTDRTAAAEASVDAEIAELKELVRIHVAGLLGEPAATNNLTTGRGTGTAVRPEGPRINAIPMGGPQLDLPPVPRNGNGHPAGAH
jgi:uncharacterized membrane protein